MPKFQGFPPMNANFTPVPNAFFDYVLPHCQPCVVSVVGAIIRATVGWTDTVTGEKRIEAELSVPDIARLAKISQNSVRKGVRQALEEGVLVETAPAGLNTGARYALRWENEERQKEAIERSRRATGDFPAPPSTFEGASKVEPLIKKDRELYLKEKKSLNVRKPAVEALAKERPTANEGGVGIYAVRDRAVEEVVKLTGDEGSQRRFQQLWEIAERNEVLDAWSVALQATQRRLRGNSDKTLERPGAYFDAVCIKEFEKREIFVPTSADKQADGDVGSIIRQGLFGEEPNVLGPKLRSDFQKPKRSATSNPPSAQKTPREALEQLEREGGAALTEFRAFAAAERAHYAAELAGLSERARSRLLAAFDRPEKRADLLRRFQERAA